MYQWDHFSYFHSMKKIIRRLILILGLFAGLFILFRYTALGDVLDPGRLAENRDIVLDYVRSYYFLSALIFVTIYILVAALSIPGATVLSLLGGFVYGPFAGVLLINIGATSGALLVFLAARFLIGNMVQQKYGKSLEKFNLELAENGKNYLLSLRLIPIFPFFLINLLAGVTEIKVSTFVWTTALGIIPGSFVYAYLGHTGASIEAGESLLSAEVLIALVLLGLFSSVPVLVKKIRSRRSREF